MIESNFAFRGGRVELNEAATAEGDLSDAAVAIHGVKGTLRVLALYKILLYAADA